MKVFEVMSALKAAPAGYEVVVNPNELVEFEIGTYTVDHANKQVRFDAVQRLTKAGERHCPQRL